MRNQPLSSKPVLSTGTAWFSLARTVLVLAAVALAGASMLTLSSCSSSTSGTTVSPNFTAIYSQVLSQNCASCHQPGGSGQNTGATLDFSTQAQAYATIFNAVSGSGSFGCTSLRNVVPGSPNTSYLMAVIDSADNTTGFGGATGCQPISSHIAAGYASSAAQTAIQTWISNGSAND